MKNVVAFSAMMVVLAAGCGHQSTSPGGTAASAVHAESRVTVDGQTRVLNGAHSCFTDSTGQGFVIEAASGQYPSAGDFANITWRDGKAVKVGIALPSSGWPNLITNAYLTPTPITSSSRDGDTFTASGQVQDTRTDPGTTLRSFQLSITCDGYQTLPSKTTTP